jgi:hypothetical protein
MNHVVTISKTLTGLSEWNENIFVPFKPSSVTINEVSYAYDGTEGGVGIIRTNLINMKPICTYTDKSVSNPMTTHKMNSTIDGQYTFYIRDVANAPSAVSDGDISITMTFN